MAWIVNNDRPNATRLALTYPISSEGTMMQLASGPIPLEMASESSHSHDPSSRHAPGTLEGEPVSHLDKNEQSRCSHVGMG